MSQIIEIRLWRSDNPEKVTRLLGSQKFEIRRISGIDFEPNYRNDPKFSDR